MDPKIHVLILNWNGSKYLDKCINSIRQNNYSNYDITIIDNNSNDNSLEKIKKLGISLISHPQNYKYAKGYNEAIFNFKNDDSDYYLLLNNDIICDSNLINSFIEGINNYGSNCIMGAKIFDAKNKDRIWYAGGKFGFFNFFVSHYGIRKKNSIQYDNDYKTSYITGCCLLISKENFHKLKGFNESFNMYGEDVDLCIRAQNLGMKCYYISNSKLWHNISSSYGGHYSLSKHFSKFNSFLKLIIKHPKKIIFGR
tara:strand:+ start:95 stop:856 length:762 start_codon:yes stop_codon:yes gene_type:complete